MGKFGFKWLGMAVTAAVLCLAVPGATVVYAAEGDGSAAQRKGADYDSYRDSARSEREEEIRSDGNNDLLTAAVVIAGAAVLYNIFKPRHNRHNNYRRYRRTDSPTPYRRHHDYYDDDDRGWHRPPPPAYHRPGPRPHRPAAPRPRRSAPRPPIRDDRPRPHR